MDFSKKDVYEMVDALFHTYASSYRQEAKEELDKMIQRREKWKLITEQHIKGIITCLLCGKQFQLKDISDYLTITCPYCEYADDIEE